jgi:hypothetical protein
MIGHIQPVANIFSITVDRQGFFLHDVQNHQGNQLFRELVGTVIDFFISN